MPINTRFRSALVIALLVVLGVTLGPAAPLGFCGESPTAGFERLRAEGQDLEARVRNNPGDSGARRRLGRVRLELGQHEEAVRHLIVYTNQNPQDSEALFWVGAALAELGHFEDSIAYSQAAIRLDPTNIVAYVNIGKSLDGLGRDEEAAGTYQQVLARDAVCVEALAGLGKLYADYGILDQALPLQMQAFELGYRDPASVGNLGNTLSGLGRYDEAIEFLKLAIQLRQDSATAWDYHNLATVYKDRATTLEPGLGNLDPSRQAAAVADYRKALEIFDQVIAFDPNFIPSRGAKGETLIRLGRHAEALALFESLLRSMPANGDPARAYAQDLVQQLRRYTNADRH